MAGSVFVIHHPTHPDEVIQVLPCVLTGLNISATMQLAWLQVSLNEAATIASNVSVELQSCKEACECV